MCWLLEESLEAGTGEVAKIWDQTRLMMGHRRSLLRDRAAMDSFRITGVLLLFLHYVVADERWRF